MDTGKNRANTGLQHMHYHIVSNKTASPIKQRPVFHLATEAMKNSKCNFLMKNKTAPTYCYSAGCFIGDNTVYTIFIAPKTH